MKKARRLAPGTFSEPQSQNQRIVSPSSVTLRAATPTAEPACKRQITGETPEYPLSHPITTAATRDSCLKVINEPATNRSNCFVQNTESNRSG
jgi:hypothetical protein